jgi:fumarate reductase iron-sulfur subunit
MEFFMKISIQRKTLQEFEVGVHDATLLSALVDIKHNQDKTLTFALSIFTTRSLITLTFSSGCRSGICGSCAVRVNGREVLACTHKLQGSDIVEPLKNVEVIKDLVVNMDSAYEFNKKAKAWQNNVSQSVAVTQEDEKINEIQSDCILCGSCYSACPVYAVNREFIGPFSLTRVLRYVSDVRDDSSNLSNVQTNGIWDCTLCNECTLVCPQDISSKMDIEKLRSRSAMAGYSDPNMANSFGGGLDFGGGFGFDGSPSF